MVGPTRKDLSDEEWLSVSRLFSRTRQLKALSRSRLASRQGITFEAQPCGVALDYARVNRGCKHEA